jgi:hypothetical protein
MKNPQVYCVATDKLGATVKKPIPATKITETQYFVLATSVKEAIDIVEASNAHWIDTEHEEEVTKAWLVTHITGGLAGSKYTITLNQS